MRSPLDDLSDVWSISDDTDQPNATRVPAGLSCISAGVSGLRGAPFRTSVSIRLWGRPVFAGYYTLGDHDSSF